MALAQMVYFIALQAPFTGGEDGLQGVPRGRLFGVLPLQNDLVLYYVVLAVVVAAPGSHRPHRPLAVRPDPEGDPRERAAHDSLGYDVDRFKLVAFVLSAALAGSGGIPEGTRPRLRNAHGCALGHIRQRDPDVPDRRHRHIVRSGRRRLRDHRPGERPRRSGRLLGDGDPRRDLRGQRAPVPQGLVGTLREFLFRSPARAA